MGLACEHECQSKSPFWTLAAIKLMLPAPAVGRSSHVLKPVGVWTRPTPDKDDDFIKPSYVPTRQEPFIQPYRREDQPLYSPAGPEFNPAELPEKQKEMPAGPKMPG